MNMMQLKCTTSNCQHNLKCHCNAGRIDVDEKGGCASRLKRAGGALEQTFKELEAGEEFLSDAPSSVRCEASCIYNEEGFCHATSLLLGDVLMTTRCATRIKPKK